MKPWKVPFGASMVVSQNKGILAERTAVDVADLSPRYYRKGKRPYFLCSRQGYHTTEIKTHRRDSSVCFLYHPHKKFCYSISQHTATGKGKAPSKHHIPHDTEINIGPSMGGTRPHDGKGFGVSGADRQSKQ